MCNQRRICLCNMTTAQVWAIWHGFGSPGTWLLTARTETLISIQQLCGLCQPLTGWIATVGGYMD